MEPRPAPTDPFIITGGDPAGIGPELLASLAPAWQAQSRPVLYFATAGPGHVESVVRAAGSGSVLLGDTEPDRPWSGLCIVVVGSDRDRESILPGRPSPVSGRLALLALDRAIVAARGGTAGMLTAPLSKEWVVRSGAEGFRGHTDYLADAFHRRVLMLMHGDSISAIPLTIHIPLSDVPASLLTELKDRDPLPLLFQLARLPAFRGSRWAMLGLNPHAGEGGVLGREEVEWLAAIVAHWRQAGLPVEGPLPADGVFLPGVRDQFRLFLGCYHDQVLVPFKALEGRRGINCTIGLPFVRTSPDHGTAFELAGRGIADHESIRRAWEFLAQSAEEASA